QRRSDDGHVAKPRQLLAQSPQAGGKDAVIIGQKNMHRSIARNQEEGATENTPAIVTAVFGSRQPRGPSGQEDWIAKSRFPISDVRGIRHSPSDLGPIPNATPGPTPRPATPTIAKNRPSPNPRRRGNARPNAPSPLEDTDQPPPHYFN